MALLDQDNPRRDESFHAKLGQILARDIDRERVTLFGCDATFAVYKVLPAGRELLVTLTSGWSAQAYNDSWRAEIVEQDNLPWASIRSGAEIDLTTHASAKRFRVTKVTQPLIAGHAWIVDMEPIERV